MKLKSALVLLLTSASLSADINAEDLLQTQESWNGGEFSYPEGSAEITSVKILLDEGAVTLFHCHPVPTMAYIISGSIEVETEDGDSIAFHEGESLVEVMNTVHRGKAVDGAVELVVFYASSAELAHTIIPEQSEDSVCAE